MHAGTHPEIFKHWLGAARGVFCLNVHRVRRLYRRMTAECLLCGPGSSPCRFPVPAARKPFVCSSVYFRRRRSLSLALNVGRGDFVMRCRGPTNDALPHTCRLALAAKNNVRLQHRILVGCAWRNRRSCALIRELEGWSRTVWPNSRKQISDIGAVWPDSFFSFGWSPRPLLYFEAANLRAFASETLLQKVSSVFVTSRMHLRPSWNCLTLQLKEKKERKTLAPAQWYTSVNIRPGVWVFCL